MLFSVPYPGDCRGLQRRHDGFQNRPRVVGSRPVVALQLRHLQTATASHAWTYANLLKRVHTVILLRLLLLLPRAAAGFSTNPTSEQDQHVAVKRLTGSAHQQPAGDQEGGDGRQVRWRHPVTGLRRSHSTSDSTSHTSTAMKEDNPQLERSSRAGRELVSQ